MANGLNTLRSHRPNDFLQRTPRNMVTPFPGQCSTQPRLNSKTANKQLPNRCKLAAGLVGASISSTRTPCVEGEIWVLPGFGEGPAAMGIPRVGGARGEPANSEL